MRAPLRPDLGGSGNGRLWLALLVALIIAGIGGLTAAIVNDGDVPQRRD